MIQIPEFVRLRNEKGLTQDELATLAGVSQQLIGEIEAGRTKTTKAIYRIAKALDVPVDMLDPAIPPWDEEFSEIVSDIRKMNRDEAVKVMARLRRDVRQTLSSKK